MTFMTRRKLTPMLLVFRTFNSHSVVCRLAGDQEKAGAEAPAASAIAEVILIQESLEAAQLQVAESHASGIDAAGTESGRTITRTENG